MKKQNIIKASLIFILSFSALFMSCTKAQNKILIVMTNNKEIPNKKGKDGKPMVGGFELSEVSRAHKVFTECGYEVEFMSPNGGMTYPEPEEKPDAINIAFLGNAKYKSQIENTLAPKQVNPKDYAAIYFAGGKTMWDFPDNKKMAEVTANIYDQGGIIGAVCHGPAALVNVKLANGKYLVEDKKVSCFTNMEEKSFSKAYDVLPYLLQTKLKERGANYQEEAVMMEQSVTDGRLVTGQNPMSTYAVAEGMMKLLGKTPPKRQLTAMEWTLALVKTILNESYNKAVKKYQAEKDENKIDSNLMKGYASYAIQGHLGENPKNKAIEMFKLVTVAKPNDAKSYEALAKGYKINGETKLAINTLKKGLKIDPNLDSSLKLMEELKSSK